MNQNEQEAIFTLALMAAFADGNHDERERAELKRISDGLNATGFNAAAQYRTVLLERPRVATVAAGLATSELRQLAFEMAVCVCNADGAQNDAERQFLEDLRQELHLPEATVSAHTDDADALAVAPVTSNALPAELQPHPDAAGGATDPERMILNYAILTGALELLPESLATLAIIPLQMKLVYRIGRQHGFELDRGHIKEFAATMGLGLTSQVVEGYARKLVGGLLGKLGGGLVRGLASQATSSAMSFATTYALGKAAQQYYAGGRRLSVIELKELFGSFSGQAHSLYGTYVGEIQRKSGEVNVRQLLPLLSQ